MQSESFPGKAGPLTIFLRTTFLPVFRRDCAFIMANSAIFSVADADSDGAHIATLIYTPFVKHFPKLIKEGHVYVAMPPLYRIDAGKQVILDLNLLPKCLGFCLVVAKLLDILYLVLVWQSHPQNHPQPKTPRFEPGRD
jgi:hypothetical protein